MSKTYAATIIAAFAASISLGACGSKPTDADCTQFADKVIELTLAGQEGEAAEMVKGMIEETKPDVIKECKEKGTKAEIDCALKATSLDELQKCDPSKK